MLATRTFSRRRLREFRRAAGLSVQDIATAVGRSWTTTRKYELGTVIPPTDCLPALAAAVGCTIDDLFEESS